MTATTLENDRELWSLTEAMCDGTITLAQRDRLQVLLEAGRSAMRFYLAYLDQHAFMLWEARGTAEAAKELSKNNIPLFQVAGGGAEGDAPAIPGHRFALPRPPSVLGFLGNSARWTREYFSQPVPLSMLTAAIFMVCVISILSILPAPIYEPSRSNHVCNTSGTGLQPVASDSDKAKKFNFVARITNLHNCRWSPDGRAPIGRDYLQIGRELKLDAGMVEITYYNGAKIVLEGPVEFKVENPNACRLDLGKLAANVPEPASGFTVETPTTTIVDLGTEFDTKVEKTGETEVYVLRGEVEMECDGSKRRITAGRAVRVETSGVVRELAKPTRRLVRALPGSPRSSQPIAYGAVKWLDAAPPSIEFGELESDKFIHIFCERRNVVLSEDIDVAIATPGLHKKHELGSAIVPKGTRVDSYYLSLDPVGSPTMANYVRCRGIVRFGRPVIGVICKDGPLLRTDKVFGATGTKYPQRHRQVDGDLIGLSGDMRTLTLNWSASAPGDQARVLVAAEPLDIDKGAN